MSVTIDISIALGSTKTGLALHGQLIDQAGANVGSPITTGFVEIGNGLYFLSTPVTDGFAGGIKIFDSAVPGTYLAATTIDTIEEDIKSKTDALPTAPAATSDCLTQAQVRTAVGMAAANLDTQLATIAGETAGIASLPTAAQIDTQLSGTHGSGAWGSGTGAGTGARTVTVTVTDGVDPIEGAKVRLTAGILTYLATSNTLGHAVFAVDDATYTLAVTKTGYSYTPSTQIVNGDEAIPAVMAIVVISAPSDPGQSNCYCYTYDSHGAAEGSIEVHFYLQSVPHSIATGAFNSGKLVATSDINGLLTVALVRGATYRAQRQAGKYYQFTVTDSDTFALPVLLGAAS